MYILVWNNQFDIDLCVTFAVYPTKESPGKDDSTTDDEYFGDPLNVADNGSWAEWQQQFQQHPDTDLRLGELGHHQHVRHLNDQVALNSDLSSCTGLWRIWSLSCLTHVIHVHMSYIHACILHAPLYFSNWWQSKNQTSYDSAPSISDTRCSQACEEISSSGQCNAFTFDPLTSEYRWDQISTSISLEILFGIVINVF